MAQLLNLRYFDEASDKWGPRRPSVPSNALSNRSFSCSSVNLGVAANLPATEYANRLGSAITPTAATFVMLLEVSQSLYECLLKESWVRSYYGMTELTTSVGNTVTPAQGGQGEKPQVVEIEHGVVILIRRGVNVDFVESLAKQFATANQPPQPIVAVHMRQFIGSGSHTLCCLHVSPTSSAEQRMKYIDDVLERLSDSENVIVAGNFYHSGNYPTGTDKDFRVSVLWNKQHGDFNDVTDSSVVSGSVPRSQLESSVWWRTKQQRLVLEEVQHLAPPNGSALFQSGLYLKLVSANREPSPPPSGSAVPTAAAAQSGGSQFVDPAVVAVTRNQPPAPPVPRSQQQANLQQSGGEGGVNLATLLASKSKIKSSDKWSVSSMLALKATARQNLSSYEQQYDITRMCGSVTEAVEKLNSGSLSWAADYAIVHNTLLAASTVACNVDAFKDYVLRHPVPSKPILLTTPPGTATASTPKEIRRPAPAGTSPTTDGPPGAVASPAGLPVVHSAPTPSVAAVAQQFPPAPQRPRIWHESHRAILYQVTPKEMIFDITSEVGLARDNIRQAISRLNSMHGGRRIPPDPSKVDKLAEWRYDYALVYSPERSAYWLLATLNVPCDVHACRYAAGQVLQGTPQMPAPISI